MLGNFEIDRPFLNLPTCAVANGDLSGVQSIFLSVPSFTINKANAVTLNGWLDAIADYKVFPIHRVIDVEDNSEDSTLVESRSNRRYQQRVGKYRFNFRVSVPVEFYTKFKAYEGQRLDAIFGDINGNIIGRSDGDNLKPITVESIMVRKITWGTYGQPCLIGVTIDLAYPSQMREVVALKSEFNVSKAKYDELVLSNIQSIIMPTKIKYGFLYNWWATQDIEGSENSTSASDWVLQLNNVNFKSSSTQTRPFNCIVDGVKFTQRTDLGEDWMSLGQGEWMWIITDVNTLAVRGLSDENFSLQPDGYVVLNKVNARSIIPAAMASEGWGVPTDAEWTALTNYIDTNYNVAPNDFGVGNHLKSCRQVNSPLGGECATTEHPRWDANVTDYGRDSVGFNALPGGYRGSYGTFGNIGGYGYWWSATESNATNAWLRSMFCNYSSVLRNNNDKGLGLSVRLIRLATAAEQLLPDGGLSGVLYTGNDEKVYRVTKIGEQVWLADNLAETKWSDGSWIQGFDGGTYTPITDANWAALTTAALCAYDDDERNVLI